MWEAAKRITAATGLSPHLCFSEASYRYRVLGGTEEQQGSAEAAEEDVDRGGGGGGGAVEIESDEVSAL